MLEIYKCGNCGKIVTIIHEGQGQLVCCKQPMVKQGENTVDAANEKHVPVVEKSADAITVVVGSVDHPMEPNHYIEWIEVIAGSERYVQHLKAGDAPRAVFPGLDGEIRARAYCNIHGLWSDKPLPV